MKNFKIKEWHVSLAIVLITLSTDVYAIDAIVNAFKKGSAALQTIGGAAALYAIGCLLFKALLRSEMDMSKIIVTLCAGTGLFSLGAIGQHFFPSGTGVNIQGLLGGM
jgi:hypothetical protein